MAVSYWEWLNRGKALSCCLTLRLLSCFKCQPDNLAQNNVLIKSDSSWRKIYEVLAARHLVLSKVLSARMRKLIIARARKNKRIARMLANARKDHSMPLTVANPAIWVVLNKVRKRALDVSVWEGQQS